MGTKKGWKTLPSYLSCFLWQKLIWVRTFRKSRDLQERHAGVKLGINLLESGVHLCRIVPTTSLRRIRRAQFANYIVYLYSYIYATYVYLFQLIIEDLQNCVHESWSLENTVSESSINRPRSTVLTRNTRIGGNCGNTLLPAKPYFLDTLIDFVQMEALLNGSTCDHQWQGKLRLFYPHSMFNMGVATHCHILFYPWRSSL
jgi:hypothetical protein